MSIAHHRVPARMSIGMGIAMAIAMAVGITAVGCDNAASTGDLGGNCRLGPEPCDGNLVCVFGVCDNSEDVDASPPPAESYEVDFLFVDGDELIPDGEDNTRVRITVTDRASGAPIGDDVLLRMSPPNTASVSPSVIALEAGSAVTRLISCDAESQVCPAGVRLGVALRRQPATTIAMSPLVRHTDIPDGTFAGSGSDDGSASSGGRKIDDAALDPTACDAAPGGFIAFRRDQTYPLELFEFAASDVRLRTAQLGGMLLQIEKPEVRVELNLPEENAPRTNIPIPAEGEYEEYMITVGSNRVLLARGCSSAAYHGLLVVRNVVFDEEDGLIRFTASFVTECMGDQNLDRTDTRRIAEAIGCVTWDVAVAGPSGAVATP